MSRLTVSDLMTHRIYTVGPEDNLATASDLFDTLDIRHLPVVDEKGELIGILTPRDLGPRNNVAAPLSEIRARLERRRVSDVMNEALETIGPDDDVRDAGRLMLENRLGCLPVIEGGRLMGILTEADYVRFIVERTGREERAA